MGISAPTGCLLKDLFSIPIKYSKGHGPKHPIHIRPSLVTLPKGGLFVQPSRPQKAVWVGCRDLNLCQGRCLLLDYSSGSPFRVPFPRGNAFREMADKDACVSFRTCSAGERANQYCGGPSNGWVLVLHLCEESERNHYRKPAKKPATLQEGCPGCFTSQSVCGL